jgi:hypothetical protein
MKVLRGRARRVAREEGVIGERSQAKPSRLTVAREIAERKRD